MVLRYCGLTESEKEKISLNSRNIYGAPYDLRSACRSVGRKNTLELHNTYRGEFCSKLVAKVFSLSGIDLIKEVSFENTTIRDIEKCTCLRTVDEDTFYELTEDKSLNPSILEKQKVVVEELMKDLRSIFSEFGYKISGLSSVFEVLITEKESKQKIKELDFKVCEAFMKSDYLTGWKEEKEMNIVNYSSNLLYEKFKGIHRDEFNVIYLEQQKINDDLLNRYDKEHKWHKNAFNYTRLETYNLQRVLYKNLIKVTKERQGVMKQVKKLIENDFM